MGVDGKRAVAATLVGLAVLFGALMQFLPWASFSFFGISFDMDLWGMDVDGNGGGEFFSWYEDAEGMECDCGMLQVAAPLVTAGLAASLVAGALLLPRMRGGNAGGAGVTALVAAGLILVGTLLYTVEMNSEDGGGASGSDMFDWAVAYWLAWASIAILVTAGVLSLMPATDPSAAASGGRPGPASRGTAAAAAAPAPAPGVRRLACPRCQNRFEVARGQRAACNQCGYGA